MIFLRSLLFNAFYAAWTLLLSSAFLPLLLAPKRWVYAVARLWARGLLVAARLLCGIQSVTLGTEHISAEPALYAVKHQSAWDIFILLSALREPAFVLKKELLSLPIIGLYFRRLEMVAVDRSKKSAALKSMVEAARNLAHERRPLVIFPEGTRTKPGEEVRYNPGVAALYAQLNVPVVPVALASGQCWGRNAFIKRPGRAVVKFLPAIPPGLEAREFIERLRGAVEAESAKLLAECSAS